MSGAVTIIIVDDHGDWRDTIAEYIQELGLGEAILTAGSLSELDQLLLAVTPGILVLDAMLPDGDGLSRVSHLRTTYPAMGIIMLTYRLLSEDKVSGLSLGADHYLTKPVNLAELGATLVSLSRRLRVVPSPDPARAEGVWRFDPARRQLLSPTRVNVDITDTESRLLGALIQAAPLPLTRGRLVEALGASAEAYDTHRLDAHMHRLRRSCARWPAATWAYARSTASATSAPRPCRSWAASRPRPESATPATPRCIPPRPAPAAPRSTCPAPTPARSTRPEAWMPTC
ncbi:response regulator transcription factor [Achromobacter xylosoxidans]